MLIAHHCTKCTSLQLRIKKRMLLNPVVYVVCLTCGKTGRFGGTEEEAVDLWNLKNEGKDLCQN